MSTLFRGAVLVSWILVSTALVAAWVWSARTRCVELGTPLGAEVAVAASLLACGGSFVAFLFRPDDEATAWQIADGLGLLAGVAAFLVALHVQPHGPCG